MLMSTLIIYAHPYNKSFNSAILNAVQANLEKKKEKFEVLDLYKDNFNPAYDAKELSMYSQGKTCRPLVEKYLRKVKHANTLIVICPIWWNSIPGILKGFIDIVMKEGKELTHINTRFGIKGELTNIEHTYVLTTSAAPTFYFNIFLGNSVKKIFMNVTLKQLGMKRRKWINFGKITNSSKIRREKYLTKIENYNFK